MRVMHRSANSDGQRHADHFVQLAADRVPLRYPDGEPTGFELDRSLRLRDGSRRGMARLDLHELIDSPAGKLAFHRGGRGYENAGDAKYGHVALGDLATAPRRPVPAGGQRGAPFPVRSDAPALATCVRSIPPAMHYKRPQQVRSGSNRGARFLHYGDPAADQGSRHDVHYTYLLWSVLDVRGGGMVRALLRDGQRVEPCDVPPVTMESYDSEGDVNGWVEGIYVRVPLERAQLFGWVISAHRLGDAEPVSHVAPAAQPRVDPRHAD
jgi:hypothetical protein